MFNKVRDLICPPYEYSEPFLMHDGYCTAHYYQWRKNIKTSQGRLMKIEGQKKWGVHSSPGEHNGLLFDECVWLK